jgi:EmrB/QacA subfamily drug resistance transporter
MTIRRQVGPWAVTGALSIGFFMIMLDTTIVNVAIPAMLVGLHATLNQIVWVNSGYLLTYAVPLLLTARLGDRLGRKRMFLLGLAVFTGASLGCALSRSPEGLIAARAVQGLGAACLAPQTMAFITTLFPPARRGAPMGAWGAVAGIATIAGPLVGGLLLNYFGWQSIFLVNVPIGAVGLVLASLLVPADRRRDRQHDRRRFDVLGTVLFTLGLLGIVFGVQNGQRYDWGRVWGPIGIPEIIGLGVALLVAFVVWQRVDRDEPLLPLSLFTRRSFTAANVANMTGGFALTSVFLPLIIYLQSVLGLSPLASGVVTVPISLVSGSVAPFAGRLSDRVPNRYVALLGFVALATGVTWLALAAQVDADPVRLLPALVLIGLGIGCVFPPLANLTIGGVEPTMAGAASGVFNTTRQVGGVLGSAAMGVLLQARLTVSMHAAASASATRLPADLRERFVASVTAAAASAAGASGGGDCAAPPDRFCALATTAFHQGVTDAARVSLLLPAAVLLLGALACVAIGRTAADLVGQSAHQPSLGAAGTSVGNRFHQRCTEVSARDLHELSADQHETSSRSAER